MEWFAPAISSVLFTAIVAVFKDMPLRVDPVVCVASDSLLMRAFVVTFIMYALLEKDTNSPC